MMIVIHWTLYDYYCGRRVIKSTETVNHVFGFVNDSQLVSRDALTTNFNE